MSLTTLKNNRLPKIILPVLFIIIIISAFYIGKQQGSYSSKIYPTLSSQTKVATKSAPVEKIEYGPATTTITLPTNGYSTKITTMPSVRSLTQLKKESEFSDAYPYYESYVKNVEEFGNNASRYIDKSYGVEEVIKFDVDMDGKDETIIALRDFVANGGFVKFIIVKNNKVIFTVNQGGRHLTLVKSESGNGFTVHWTPIVGTKEEMERSYCCPIAHMETRFIYNNGTFKPSTERKVANPEDERKDDAPIDGTVACENYKDIKIFDKPVNIVWIAKLDGCLMSCSGAYFTTISGESKYSRFAGYSKDSGTMAQEYLDADVLKVYGKWTGVSDDYAKGIFGNRCVPSVEIDKIEIIK